MAVCAHSRLLPPSDVANELNRRQAASEGIEVDRLKKPAKSWSVGRVMREELELQRLKRDKAGARYKLTPERQRELAERFDVELPGGSGNPTPSTPLHRTPENQRFWPQNGDYVGGVGSTGGVGADGIVGQPDDSDTRERAPIQAVEAEAERGSVLE